MNVTQLTTRTLLTVGKAYHLPFNSNLGQNYGSLREERLFHISNALRFFSFSLEKDRGLPKNDTPKRYICHTRRQNDTPKSVRNLKNYTSLGHVKNLGKR